MNPVPLAGVDDGAQPYLLPERIARGQPVGVLGQPADVLLGDPFMHQVPPSCHADLALVEERSPGAAGRGLLEVDVVEDHQRGVAAQFEVHPLQVLCAECRDGSAAAGRAGEGDHPDAGSITW